MASFNQKIEIEIGGTSYTAKTDIDTFERIEDATDMGALQLLRAAAAPTMKTREIVLILSLTLFRNVSNPDASMKPTPIGEAGARMLVAKVGYFEAVAAVLKILGALFKGDGEKKPEAGDEAA